MLSRPANCLFISSVHGQVREDNRSIPLSADVNNAWSYTSCRSYLYDGVIKQHNFKIVVDVLIYA
jgi:hypothetical protein